MDEIGLHQEKFTLAKLDRKTRQNQPHLRETHCNIQKQDLNRKWFTS